MAYESLNPAEEGKAREQERDGSYGSPAARATIIWGTVTLIL